MRCFLALALILDVASMTGAANGAGSNTIGAGTASCGTWIEARRERISVGAEQWIFGFLSGVGFMGIGDARRINPLSGVDGKAVLAWIDNYCRAHPADNITTAGIAFMVAHPR